MLKTTEKSAYLQGVRAGLPFLFVVLPFSMLFGVVAIDADLSFAQIMAFSSLVIAGASQFAALHTMSEGAPVILVIVTGLVVNLRMAMYSAALLPHLGQAPLWQRALIAYGTFDQSYAVSVMAYENAPDMGLRAKTNYFFGVVTPIAPGWVLGTWLGAALGLYLPLDSGLDFALPLAFLAMLAPMIKRLPHVITAITAASLALVLDNLPAGIGLLIAALVAMGVGALVEIFMEPGR